MENTNTPLSDPFYADVNLEQFKNEYGMTNTAEMNAHELGAFFAEMEQEQTDSE